MLLLVVCCAGLLPLRADDPPATPVAVNLKVQKEALAHWNSLIGGWRGTGQPRRGSNTGAWREDTHWAWQFSETETALIGTVEKGKLATTLKITAAARPEIFARRCDPNRRGLDYLNDLSKSNSLF